MFNHRKQSLNSTCNRHKTWYISLSPDLPNRRDIMGYTGVLYYLVHNYKCILEKKNLRQIQKLIIPTKIAVELLPNINRTNLTPFRWKLETEACFRSYLLAPLSARNRRLTCTYFPSRKGSNYIHILSLEDVMGDFLMPQIVNRVEWINLIRLVISLIITEKSPPGYIHTTRCITTEIWETNKKQNIRLHGWEMKLPINTYSL